MASDLGLRRLDRDEARQLAVRAQLLEATVGRSGRPRRPPYPAPDRPDGRDRAERRPRGLEPARCLVPAGAADPALQQDRTLFELRAFIRPMTAVALHVPEETGYTAQSSVQTWIGANDRFRPASRPAARRRAAALPRPAGHLPGAGSSPGWTIDRNVNQMLEFPRSCAVRSRSTSREGTAAPVGRRRARLSRGSSPLPAEDARVAATSARLRSLGLARAERRPVPGRADRGRRGRRPGDRRRTRRRVAGGPRRARPALHAAAPRCSRPSTA